MASVSKFKLWISIVMMLFSLLFGFSAQAAISEIPQANLFKPVQSYGGIMTGGNGKIGEGGQTAWALPANSVVVEVGYGSDDTHWFMEIQEGHFQVNGDGSVSVVYDGLVSTSFGTERKGTWVTLVPPAGNNGFIQGWGWDSSHTSGGRPGDPTSPTQACTHLRYVKYDPNTFQLLPGEYEGGNCSARGYNYPGDIRGRTRANSGRFIIGINRFIFGNDGEMRGGWGQWHKIQNGSYLNAAYVSDNIPSSFTAGEAKSQGTDGQELRITLRNTGTLWWSASNYVDLLGTQSGSCSVDTNADGVADCPQDTDPIGTACSVTRRITSTLPGLKHISGSFIVGNDPVPFRNQGQTTCQVTSFDSCDLGDCTDQTSCERFSGCYDTNDNPMYSCDQFTCGVLLGIGDPCEQGVWYGGSPDACGGTWGPWDQGVERISSPSFAVGPNQTADFFISSLTAPTTSGNVTDQWQMQGSQFGSILVQNTNIVSNSGTIQVNSRNSVTSAPVSSSGSVFGPQTFNYTNVGSQQFSNAQSGDYNLSVTPGSAGALYTLKGIETEEEQQTQIKFAFGSFGFLKGWMGKFAQAFNTSSSCPGGVLPCNLGGGGSISFAVDWNPEATLDLSPTTLNLTGTVYGSNPTGTVAVQNNGASGSTLNWSISGASQSWLSGSPPSGNGVAAGSSQNSTITANISGLVAGTYNGNTVSFTGTSQPSGSPLPSSGIPIPVTVNLTLNNPIPVISSLNPSTRQAGTGSFSVDVTGSNFVNDGNLFRLSWNGMNRPTTFINSTLARMTVNSTDILSAGTANIRASNPAPGGGTSNALIFTITPGNSPPGTPTGAQALSPIAQGSDYCTADNRYQFTWTYSDSNGDPQGGYRVQVARDSGFTQIVDDSNPGDAPTSGGSSTSYTPLVGMPYNSTLYFRVKVWDSQGAVSSWSSTVSFVTINHAYPIVTFSPPPPATVPANVVTQFTSGGTCYDSTGASIPCGSWAWNFGDGGTSTQQNPGHIYATSSANTTKTVSHTVTDTSGQACTLQQNLNIGDAQNLPDWKEVGPL